MPRSAPLLLLLVLAAAGCSSAEPELPTPRPLVIHSGARIAPEVERLEEIDEWVRAEMQNIQEDPSFLIVLEPVEREVYPWQTLRTSTHAEAMDTARVSLERTGSDAGGPYMIYAHLHLMHEAGRIGEFAPEAEGETGYALERAVLERVADAWLLGRAVYDFAPYRPMDELLYARENGWLDAFILTARAEDFPDEREAWLAENPGRDAEFERWFRQTFAMEPPGRRDPDAEVDDAGRR